MDRHENPFAEWIRLEQPRLGSRVVCASDDFFAPKERLIQPQEPVFVADRYDDHGKWMDGWESRRRREPGHDDCIVRLGVPGVIRGIDIDTRFFTGNFPTAASVDACHSGDEIPGDDAGWFELVSRTDLLGNAHHYLPVAAGSAVTHLRLNIYPDGGVARLRIFGEVVREATDFETGQQYDLLAIENGGRAIMCSDEHYGSMHNLNLPGRGLNSGDGWETARRRGPGNDWVVLALGRPGRVQRIEIDTAHFKGNYPDRARVLAARQDGKSFDIDDSRRWPVLLPEVKLGPDAVHYFDTEFEDAGPVTHVRLDIFPDGGVSRLRIFAEV
jgi:allantoicase